MEGKINNERNSRRSNGEMNKNSKSQYRVNGQIHARTVALINADGKMVGEYSTNVALQLAREVNLDLVEINPNANPPLAKIVDYSKLNPFKTLKLIRLRETVIASTLSLFKLIVA